MEPRETPMYVKVGLFGVGSRIAAQLYLLASLALAVGLTLFLRGLGGFSFYWRRLGIGSRSNGWTRMMAGAGH